MIIKLERSGGFAGISQRAVIDTDQLDPQERQELENLVESSGFFRSNPVSASSQSKTDRFHYKITIEKGAQQRTVEMDEDEIPEEWQALIQRINTIARRFRR